MDRLVGAVVCITFGVMGEGHDTTWDSVLGGWEVKWAREID